jgi:CheY-like chemotaxis protein
LAVVQGIVRRHGGAITVASASGAGTTFHVFFPCSAERAVDTRGTRSTVPLEEVSGAGTTVLVVEDEDSLRLSVAKMLRKHGFSVINAEDGFAAIEKLREHAGGIDAVLLDLTIPGPSSREVFEEIRRLKLGVKLVLTTAYSRETAAASFDLPQAAGFLRKPYELGALLRLLQPGPTPELYGERPHEEAVHPKTGLDDTHTYPR